MTFRYIPCLIVVLGILSAQINAQEKTYSAQDLNELMARVWQNCKIDLDNLRGYIFNEKDTLYGKKFSPGSDSRTRVEDSFYYVWTANNGYLGPSLKKINGKEVTVNGKKLKITQKEFALVRDPDGVKWYVNQRQKHHKWERWDTILDFYDDLLEGWSEYRRFDRFDYKPREYRYEGSREYQGHHVIEITYPSRADWGIGTTLVRMLVIPEENQLVSVALSLFFFHAAQKEYSMTPDNVWKNDFPMTTRDNSPDIVAKNEYTMTMDNSHDNVWLPKEFRQSGTSSWGGVWKITREFDSYAKTDVKAKLDVKTRIRFDADRSQPKQ